MAVLIVNCGTVDGAPPEARYLQRFDPDWTPADPRRKTPRMTGRAWWTDKVEEAQRFPDTRAALAEWKRQSTVLPIRPWDGRPNRPLTAYTVTFDVVEDLP